MANPKMRTGAQILVDILVDEGVDLCFGLTGGAILPVYDELYQNRHRIKLIDTRHEQGAIHMAEGYAKSTGKVGVAVVTLTGTSSSLNLPAAWAASARAWLSSAKAS